MSMLRRTSISLIASAGLMLAAVVPASGEPTRGRPFTVELTGAAEVTPSGVPNQGDPDGSGAASLTLNPGQRQVCWTIEVTGVDPITAAHIHFAPATTTGPVVVPLAPYTGGCTPISRELAIAIITDPGSYYVNVHNQPYPGGALRGQFDG